MPEQTRPWARLCAPLTADSPWRHDVGVVRSLGIGAVELERGWAETAGQQIAALAEALRGAGMRVAVAQAPACTVTPDALGHWLAGFAPLAIDSLLLPPQPPPADADGAWARFADLAGIAEQHSVVLLLQNDPAGWPADGVTLGRFVAGVGRAGLSACFDPALSVGLKKHPFLTELMPGPLKRYMHCLRLRDAVFSDGSEVLPNEGNAELKELVSALECRGYLGWYALSPFGKGSFDKRLTATAAAVSSLLDSL